MPSQMNICKCHIIIAVLVFSFFAVTKVAFSQDTMVFSYERGGKGGAPFVDMVAPGGSISGITIRSGSLIDNIQLIYRYKNKHNIASRPHGGSGGKTKTFRLKKGEYIAEIGGTYGKYVNTIYVKTNKRRKANWGGKRGKRSFKFAGPIRGIWGRSGALLDAIGVIKKSKPNKSPTISVKNNISAFKPDPDRFGSKGGGCDKCDSMTNPIYPALTSNFDYEFWKKQNTSLYKIVQKLANPTSKFSVYINDVERVHCDGIMFCEIDTRIDLLEKAMGVK